MAQSPIHQEKQDNKKSKGVEVRGNEEGWEVGQHLKRWRMWKGRQNSEVKNMEWV